MKDKCGLPALNFSHMSCIVCNKGTDYEYNKAVICYHCKHTSISQPLYVSFLQTFSVDHSHKKFMWFLFILTRNYIFIINGCQIYVKVVDGTGKLAAVMFGTIANEALGRKSIDFMNHSGEIINMHTSKSNSVDR